MSISKGEFLAAYERWLASNKDCIVNDAESQAIYANAGKVAKAYNDELKQGLLAWDELDINDVRAFALAGSYLGCTKETVASNIDKTHLSDANKALLKESFTTTYKNLNKDKLGFFKSSERAITNQNFPYAAETISLLINSYQNNLDKKPFNDSIQLVDEFKGFDNGVLSEMLHVIAPECFHITNSQGRKYWKLLINGFENLSYAEKCKKAAELRGSLPWWRECPSYRLLDLFWMENKDKFANGSTNKEDRRESHHMETDTIDYPKNIILYGPPGTGKTFNSVNYAVAICEGKEIATVEKENHGDVKRRFDDYRQEGRIEFVTFHQSYGYEDFIEGLRPITPSDDEYSDEGDLKYDVFNGVFKNICENADEYTGKSAADENGEDSSIDVESVIEQYATYLEDKTTDGEEVPLRGNVTIIQVNRYQDGRPRSFVLGGSIKSHQWISFKTARRDFAEYLSGSIKSRYDIKATKGSNAHGCSLYLFALYEKMKEFMESEQYEAPQPKEHERKNFVLIIDEINRGNISKIFGELITLIEDSKRKGAPDEMSVILPYSGDEFSVPDNLYILGTMNTADRSIALMDTALRRRFNFVEMMPNSNLIRNESVEDIDIYKIMETINKRIEALYDREHTIGHSYFMGIETFDDLKAAFKDKIIPLLQEYFYDDYEKIRLVLADNAINNTNYQFITAESNDSALFFGNFDYDDANEQHYSINEKAFREARTYIKIYEQSALDTNKPLNDNHEEEVVDDE